MTNHARIQELESSLTACHAEIDEWREISGQQTKALAAMREERDTDICEEHRKQGGDPECDRCFRQNYEEIGRELVQRIKQQMPEYSYVDSPVEVVGDLLSQIDEVESKVAHLTEEREGFARLQMRIEELEARHG